MTTMTTFNTTRMDVTMLTMQESLGRISDRLHTDLIPAAEQDVLLAEELVGTENLEQPDITKAMEEANRVRSPHHYRWPLKLTTLSQGSCTSSRIFY